jgi:tetratricopeptide (TPR) repeat protein
MAALAVALSRQRLRTLLALAIVAATTLTAWDPLLAVFEQSNAGNPIGPPFDDAARAVALSVGLAAAAGITWGLIDARLVLPRRLHRALVLSATVGAGLALLIGAVAVSSEIDNPRERLAAEWSEFKEGYSPDVKRSRFEGSFASDRYQEWTIAWKEFVAHPITGIGADNYQAAFYLRRGDSDHHPRYPHSLPLRLLSQLGIVGSALFAGFVACALLCGIRRRRLSNEIAGGAVAAAIAVFAYWVLHGSVDWFWEIPALAAPALGFLGLAASPAPGPTGVTPSPIRRRATYWAAAAGALSAVALVLPWLSQAYENAGAAGWRRDTTQAYARFERAAELNPLMADPLLVKGSIALQQRNLLVARDALTRAEEREPKNWYIHFQLALAEAVADRQPSARLHIVRAAELNPRDPVVAAARRQILRGETPNPERLNGRFVAELNRRFGLDVPDPTR